MSNNIEYTTVNRIISKLYRDISGTDLNETNLVEWVGEALEFLKVPQIQDQAVAFIEVKNHHADIPQGFQMVLQIARNNHWEKTKKFSPCSVIECVQNDIEEVVIPTTCNEECESPVIVTDCNGFVLQCGDIVDYKPAYDLKFFYQHWHNSKFYRRHFTPVRLANHTLFNSIVCKEKVDECMGCTDEYTIVGTTDKRLRFSFPEGQIAMAYLKNAIDDETGYPLVPDEISYITAITYYIKWKIAEWLQWNSRQGSQGLAEDNERKWLKYARQAKNNAKMPKSIDDFQDLLEQTHYLIPNHKKYYGFFGNLGKSQQLGFNMDINIRYGNTNE